jgi:hypothetical protein
MKRHILSITLIVLSFTGLHAQTYNLTVNGGYGSGNYQVGDTVHVWSEAFDNTKTFSHWTGDTQYLEMPNEWHTTLIMPNQNIAVTSVISNMPTYTINYEQIMGVNNLKNVYSYFPSNLKGVIYLFHGTGGNASNWINTVEYRSFVNSAIADSFGIIATEAEEITLNTDLNGDGKLRWLTFPIDTTNGIDYLNIKTITDTFISRGDITNSTPKNSVGMSNGGSFSAAISYAYNYQAGISYCASSAQAIFSIRNNPFAFRMAKYDDNAEVGPQGNYEAWQSDSILKARSVCHDYEICDRQPIYPERFARIPGISITTSQAIFNDLSNNGLLDINNYALHSDTIKNNILANPPLYPNIIALPVSSQIEALNQIAASNAEHKFYSDYNSETLDFINNLCSTTVGIKDIYSEKKNLNIFPNPTIDYIKMDLLEEVYSIFIINNIGQRVFYLDNLSGLTTIDVSMLGSGIYIIQATNEKSILTSKFVKK